MNTKNRGFASMDSKDVKRIASLGGKAVSQNSAYMAEIGRKGGEASGRNRRNKAAKDTEGGTL